MNRRRFMAASIVGLATAVGASCASNGAKEMRSTETVSSVMFTIDQRYLVVITSKHHYFFDVPDPLRASIQGSFHPYVRARFSEFVVDPGDKIQGNVNLSLEKEAPAEAVQAAIKAGFRQGPSTVDLTIGLQGSRFKGNDVHFPDQYRLNHTYRITVVSQGDPTKMSPVTEIAGKASIYGVLLVVAPQVLFSKER